MPISNKSSEHQMTTTSIRIDPTEMQRREEMRKSQRTRMISNNNQPKSSGANPPIVRRPVNMDNPPVSRKFPTVESSTPLPRESTPILGDRGSPRVFRVKRVPRTAEPAPPTPPPPAPKPEITTKTTVVKDVISRGTTTPPPTTTLFEPQPTYRLNQTSYYPSSYSIREPRVSPIVQTVRYQTPPVAIHPTASSTEFVVHQTQPQTNASTTTKTSTRILDAKTLPGLGEDSFIEETRTTTTVIRPVEVPAVPALISSTTTTTVPPAATVASTTIRERPAHRYRRRRRPSLSTVSISSSYSSITGSSSAPTTVSTVTPRHHIIKQHTVLPPRPPIETTIINDYPKEVVPERRIIRQVRRVRTYSGYYSSDLEHGKRKIYKSDYKYRHYYYCNWCKGRCDLPNSSCSCCEWFYGCPVWGLILSAFLFLALLVTFFTLLGLQPTINPTRQADTAQTRLTNRTQVIYGFLQNCGYQVGTPTTLALCANTQTTSTSKVILSPSITTLKDSAINLKNVVSLTAIKRNF